MPAAAADGRLVCTNHLLHRWPDPGRLPADSAAAATAGLTYQRWRLLDQRVRAGSVVDRNDIRAHLDAVRFAAPALGARTVWQVVYDLDQAALDVSFFLRHVGDVSHYTSPTRFRLH